MERTKSREFLFALIILMILASWAVSAQDVSVIAADEEATRTIFTEGASTVSVERLDLWKKIQLNAVAMSNPSALVGYDIGTMASLSGVVGGQSTLDEAAIQELGPKINLNDWKIGYFEGSDFRQLSLGSSCLHLEGCNHELLGQMFDAAARSEELGVTYTVDSSQYVKNIPVSDVFVIWPESDASLNLSGTKVLIKPWGF